jgi:hypothetical protein
MGTSNNYGILVRKLPGRQPLGRSRRRWQNNIKINPMKMN